MNIKSLNHSLNACPPWFRPGNDGGLDDFLLHFVPHRAQFTTQNHQPVPYF
jgi:hypothetical protein